jgi:hypothetical protein
LSGVYILPGILSQIIFAGVSGGLGLWPSILNQALAN